MITIVKKDKIMHNIEAVVKSLRSMYKKSSLVVECDKKVTGMIELIFNAFDESDNQAMIVRVRRNMSSSNDFTDYIVNKDTLRAFKIDDVQLGVTMEVADRRSGRVTKIVMYFLACLTPVLMFPKIPSRDITVTRSHIDLLRNSRYWEEDVKSFHG